MRSMTDSRPDARAWAPGRTEIAGNHVDHQGGRVIAAAIDRGIEIIAQRNDTGLVRLMSDGFDDVSIAIGDLAPHENEKGTTVALVRGVLAGCAEAGAELAGFDARATSTLPVGGGLSSSAAFELALVDVICQLAGIELPAAARALIGQHAECEWFGKPCGLMDQLASATGGISLMDFRDGEAPAVERIKCDFAEMGLAVCIIDVGADHSALSGSYANIPDDMSSIARLLGATRLRDVDEIDFLREIGRLRKAAGDLATLRALHFYNEMRLVDERAEALSEGDAHLFLEATRRSASSSAQLLRNIDAPGPAEPAGMALAVAELFLGPRGAARIHGGGFGGSIQAFVPIGELEAFCTHMADALPSTRCIPVAIETH